MGVRYDVVIVGAGAAGCVLAGRLSEDPGRPVLLVEAGADAASTTTEGSSFVEAASDPSRTYDLRVRRTAVAAATPYPVGRGVGGSAAINGMVGLVGLPADYDRWERDLGCPGWGWADVAPVFAQLTTELNSAPPAEWGAVDHALVAGAQQLGHRYPIDLLDAAAVGVGAAPLTRVGGARASSAEIYLGPARARPNLTIRVDTTVSAIALAGARAVGVITGDGELIDAREVIVSAGAIHSPALLQRSGVDLPGVGRGLKDHPSSSFALRLRAPAPTHGLAAATLLRWSSLTGRADLQILPVNHVSSGDYGALLISLMDVRSAGIVETRGDVLDVRFDMLADDEDRQRLREATRHARSLIARDPFTSLCDAVFIDDAGTRIDALPESDDELDAWMMQHSDGCFHASCTCRMGPRSDENAVIDAQGRVHGYEGLRVCDASIFPDLPRAPTQLPTMMVAERIAAMISAS